LNAIFYFFFDSISMEKNLYFDMIHETTENTENKEAIPKLDWKFLISEIPENSLVLDARSEEEFKENTVKGAFNASFIRKPHGSSTKSMLKLSSYLQTIVNLSSNYENIVIFDEGIGMFAGKLCFLLKSVLDKNKNVYIWDKIFNEIDLEKLQPGTEENVIQETEVKKPFSFKDIVPISFIQTNLVKVQLIDVRTKEEYEGLLPRYINPEPGSICGRIPGAIHFDWLELYDDNGHLLPKQLVIKKLRQANLILERPTILYDFNGARSCFVALVLKECKYRDVKVFLGSWLEWRKTKLPKQNVKIWYPEN
jgi:thiosulfate/3-mercaptopyruvate sulfurtransferase